MKEAAQQCCGVRRPVRGATIASITQSTTYTEHGLIAVTYATVADPADIIARARGAR